MNLLFSSRIHDAQIIRDTILPNFRKLTLERNVPERIKHDFYNVKCITTLSIGRVTREKHPTITLTNLHQPPNITAPSEKQFPNRDTASPRCLPHQYHRAPHYQCSRTAHSPKNRARATRETLSRGNKSARAQPPRQSITQARGNNPRRLIPACINKSHASSPRGSKAAITMLPSPHQNKTETACRSGILPTRNNPGSPSFKCALALSTPTPTARWLAGA